jgi:hypothetical protein
MPFPRLFMRKAKDPGAADEPHGVTIRFWHGCYVIAVVTVHPNGGSEFGAGMSPLDSALMPDIELDPWAGLAHIVNTDVTGRFPFHDGSWIRSLIPDDPHDEPPF